MKKIFIKLFVIISVSMNSQSIDLINPEKNVGIANWYIVNDDVMGGISKSYLSISFLIVVDSPPGIIKPLISESSFGFLTIVQFTLMLSKTLICSAKSPCSASTPILTLDLTNLFFLVFRMGF